MMTPEQLDLAMDEIEETQFYPWDVAPSFHATKFGGALILEFDGEEFHAEIILNPVRTSDILNVDTLAIIDEFQSSVNHICSDQMLLEKIFDLLRSGREAETLEGGVPGSENS